MKLYDINSVKSGAEIEFNVDISSKAEKAMVNLLNNLDNGEFDDDEIDKIIDEYLRSLRSPIVIDNFEEMVACFEGECQDSNCEVDNSFECYFEDLILDPETEVNYQAGIGSNSKIALMKLVEESHNVDFQESDIHKNDGVWYCYIYTRIAIKNHDATDKYLQKLCDEYNCSLDSILLYNICE